ncbi:MAG: tripartite tricarboxylate transporter substrate binding protein [Betaproteobacteria bacterium]|nr:tripartite tricarboxylate transporter substrate binding protein [Betaproteobacteria bacterium]
MRRKHIAPLAAALGFTVFFFLGAAVAAYPERPVRYIVTSNAGGAPDIIARTFATELGRQMGQQFVVDNRPGASGTIATEMLARAAPDGYTIQHATIVQLAINRSVLPKLPYHPDKDLRPVLQTTATPNLLAVTLSLPAESVQELIDYARKNPGKLQYASGGNATPHHISAELFKLMTGTDMLHVPYKGAGAANIFTDLVTGRVHLIFDNILSIAPHVRAGRVRGLGVTSAIRVAAFPELPTVAEAGVPGFEMTAWGGTIVPAGVTNTIVARLNAEFNKVLMLPHVREKLNALGAEVVGGTPDQFSEHIRKETAKWAEVVKRAGVKVD